MIALRRKRTPGLANAEYGSRTSSSRTRPNITSSFEAEDKRLGLVDQRDARVLSERLGQLGRQLGAGEACTEDENALAHESSLCEAEARAAQTVT